MQFSQVPGDRSHFPDVKRKAVVICPGIQAKTTKRCDTQQLALCFGQCDFVSGTLAGTMIKSAVRVKSFIEDSLKRRGNLSLTGTEVP